MALRLDLNSGFPDEAFMVNILLFAVGIIVLIQQFAPVPTQFTWVLLFVMGVLNLTMRIFTTQPAPIA